MYNDLHQPILMHLETPQESATPPLPLASPVVPVAPVPPVSAPVPALAGRPVLVDRCCGATAATPVRSKSVGRIG